jgi:hypothetical protein
MIKKPCFDSWETASEFSPKCPDRILDPSSLLFNRYWHRSAMGVDIYRHSSSAFMA